MAGCMLTLGLMYATGAGSGRIGKWVAVSIIYIFIATYVSLVCLAGEMFTQVQWLDDAVSR